MDPSKLLRLALVTAALATLAAACGSTDVRPCNDGACPEVAGSWELRFEDGPLPEECAALERDLPKEPLELTQVGSGLTSSLAGVPLRGTLYDTWDFSLNGVAETDGGTATVTVNGRYVPGVAATDAGERLQGSFTGNYGQGSTRCLLSRGYTARRAQ